MLKWFASIARITTNVHVNTESGPPRFLLANSTRSGSSTIRTLTVGAGISPAQPPNRSLWLPRAHLPIEWLIRRVADFNRRLRFSLTPKNFFQKMRIHLLSFVAFGTCCSYIIPDNRCREQSIPLDGTARPAWRANYLAVTKPIRS
jgi:hypothetical protein